MAIELNHTIVWSRDKKRAAEFFAEILGLPPPKQWGGFEVIVTSNGVNLDFHDSEGEIASQHYAFLVSETEFDEIFGRIQAKGLDYWADPACEKAGEINHHDGGRGVYFPGTDGHLLEIITRPYGSGGWDP
ncbi:MAG: hypothetical protein RLZ98_1564 [Pseudomonadota bacterium]|jgi:catechol 2,3-dioxygenase-like lactoylglutathione lyase family enzyme